MIVGEVVDVSVVAVSVVSAVDDDGFSVELALLVNDVVAVSV